MPVPPMPDSIDTASDAEAVIARIQDTIERLHLIVQRETALIRAARLKEATALEEEKRTLAGEYQCHLEIVRRHGPRLSRFDPEGIRQLLDAHASLQKELTVNLAVVGTARGVTEDIIRNVSDRVARRQMPSVYGASGTQNTRPAHAPVSLSRTF